MSRARRGERPEPGGHRDPSATAQTGRGWSFPKPPKSWDTPDLPQREPRGVSVGVAQENRGGFGTCVGTWWVPRSAGGHRALSEPALVTKSVRIEARGQLRPGRGTEGTLVHPQGVTLGAGDTRRVPHGPTGVLPLSARPNRGGRGAPEPHRGWEEALGALPAEPPCMICCGGRERRARGTGWGPLKTPGSPDPS